MAQCCPPQKTALEGGHFVLCYPCRFHPAAANPTKDIVHPYNQLVRPFPRAQEEAAQGAEAGAGGGRGAASPFKRRTTLVFFQGSLAGRPVSASSPPLHSTSQAQQLGPSTILSRW